MAEKADRSQEQVAGEVVVRTLALCDLAGLPKVGIKGRNAASWLLEQALPLPETIYQTCRLPGGGWIVRLGAADFFLEDGPSGSVVEGVNQGLARGPAEVYRVERGDATFLLMGRRAVSVLAQMCSIDFARSAPGQLILTRLAGINGGVLPDQLGEVPVYRLWVDPSYAVSMWETLEEITNDLGGRVVEAGLLPAGD